MTLPTRSQERKSSASIEVKCVICGHKKTIRLSAEHPMCSKCYGPVVAGKVEVRRGR
jgi:hypothetical protein